MTYYLNIVFFSNLENNLRLILQIKYNLLVNINLTFILSFLFILKYYNHFDGYHRIYKIPELNELIDKLLEE